MQARALAAIAGGCDVVVNAGTGSGKGLLMVLPALADWASAEPGLLGLVDLVTVPYTALGVHLETSMNALFAQLAAQGKARSGARALFVHLPREADQGESG